MSLIPIKVGIFLAIRQVKRASLWTTILIITIMTLTFLNLVVVSGLLVGLIEGAVSAQRDYYTGDVIISTLSENSYIEQSPSVIKILESLPFAGNYTARFTEPGVIEANYKLKSDLNEKPDEAATNIVGINPDKEDSVTGLKSKLVEGEYLDENDFDQVVVGGLLLSQYFSDEIPGFEVIDNVGIGTRVRIKVGGIVREVTVKGILRSKVDNIDRSVFMTDKQLRSMIGRYDFNVDEIAVSVPDHDSSSLKNALILNGVDKFAKVQTFEEAQPKFLKDIKQTFALLGTIISSIGLVVAAITVFIVIFINAITRRKYIGILKGIGINGKALEVAYIFQSIFYAVIGSILGLLIVYFALLPYFLANPINFPFSDGILVAPPFGTAMRVLVLLVTTVIAGYIPARIIITKNTLDSILGRK